MRILVTIPWGQRLGGAEAMLQTVLAGASARGHELEPVFLEDGPWAHELAAAGFTVHVLDAGRLREAHRYLATIARLARLFRQRRPELILNWSAKTHLYGAPGAALAGMADRVVWWQHDIPSPRGIDLLATALPARAIGTTSRSAAAAQAHLRPRRPTFTVHAGIAPPSPSRSPSSATPQFERPPGAVVVGIVGRLQPWKGQDRLLRTHALLRARGLPVHSLIVGGDAYGLSPQYARSLPRLAEQLGIAGEVTFAGQVPDAGPYIEEMDVLVNASEPEPYGIVLLEAMSRGVAAVAVDAGGPRELIEHERTGMLAASGAPEALADALEPLVRSPELRHTIAAAARAHFQAELTDERMRERLFAALEALL